ncbi:MAG: penicillin-binding protein activator LpoB [Gammaproteobacteria bacterium SG8_11]|nr:MAG: penicillin-binding protein activator LpoB [Gammaproteobacteria bacterium SG8_11]
MYKGRFYNIFTSLVVVMALTFIGCSTKVERVKTDEVIDLSGQWNDTDSRLVSEEMMSDVLARPWVDNYVRSHTKPPAVIVGEVRNLSHEHLNVNTFLSDVEKALINSGRVKVVASRVEREEIREERADQDINASEETRKAMGRELGADFMLKGTINTIIDEEGSQAVKFYQVDLTLISLADNSKVWVGQKKIKKFVDKRSLRF